MATIVQTRFPLLMLPSLRDVIDSLTMGTSAVIKFMVEDECPARPRYMGVRVNSITRDGEGRWSFGGAIYSPNDKRFHGTEVGVSFGQTDPKIGSVLVTECSSV